MLLRQTTKETKKGDQVLKQTFNVYKTDKGTEEVLISTSLGSEVNLDLETDDERKRRIMGEHYPDGLPE